MTNWKKVDADRLDSKLSLIADAIREKTGNTKSMTIDEMPTIINEIKVDDGSFKKFIEGTLTSVTIPEGITVIRDYAFNGFKSLQSVDIPNGVTTIGISAFRDCSSLNSLTLPDSVTTIGGAAFRGCSSIVTFTVPDSVTSIAAGSFGEGVFAYCTRLQSVVIGKNVASLSGPVFYASSALRTVKFKGKPQMGQSQGAYAFAQLTGLADIYVPWSQGAVAGAPWGATNATIHYNTIYDENNNPIV